MRLSEYLFLMILVSAELMAWNQNMKHGSVVQLVRMSLWYSEGRRFEFFLTHHEFLLSCCTRLKKFSVHRSLGEGGRKVQRFKMRLESKMFSHFWFQIFHGISNGICFYSNILLIGFYVANWIERFDLLNIVISKYSFWRVITKVIIQLKKARINLNA